MPALWKQDSTLHPTFAKHNRCLEEDWFLLPFELRLQRAHAKTLLAARILSNDEAAQIARGLDRIEQQFAAAPCPQSDDEDLHTWIEARLTEQAGEAGRKIHTARSRNDQVATLLKMYCIDAGRKLAGLIGQMAAVACRRATDWSELALPLQTHCQFAAPGTVGFWILRYATAWQRIRERLVQAAENWSEYCPLGAGAVAGSSIPIDRRIQAKELGFRSPAQNALDATSTRDECLELLAIAAHAALHLQSFATDVIAFSQTPFAWTVYPKAFATGSSMMPNKANPDAMELLRGECSAVLAAHTHALMLLKGLPSGYNRDLQCIKPLLRQTLETLASCCEMVLAFIKELSFDPEALRGSMNRGNITATLYMEDQVRKGTPLRDAHHAVAGALRDGKAGLDGDSKDWINRYQTIGSAAPAETRRVAAELLAALAEGPAANSHGR